MKLTSFLRAFTYLILAVGIFVLPCSAESAQPREISLVGDFRLKLSLSPGSASLRGTVLDDAVLVKEGERTVLKEKSGQVLLTGILVDPRTVRLESTGKSSATIIRFEGNQFRIFTSEPETLRFRVKIKDDKFNIYDPDSTRIMHGKQKPDGFGVKNADGTQVLKIKGTSSLEESARLSAPLSPEERVVFWGVRYLQ